MTATLTDRKSEVLNKQMTETWKQFLTVGDYNSTPIIMDWNTEESYKNTSPGNALKKHKEMYPSQSIKVVSV